MCVCVCVWGERERETVSVTERERKRGPKRHCESLTRYSFLINSKEEASNDDTTADDGFE